MFSKQLKEHLVNGISNREIADQIEKIMVQETPNQAKSKEIIASLSSRVKPEEIKRYIVNAISNQIVGESVADRVEKARQVIKAKADETAAVAASFTGKVAGMTTDVTITADVAGADGNDVTLSFDGIDDIDTAILDWNTANPANTITLTDGDGTQVPNNLEEISLAGGSDLVSDVASKLSELGSKKFDEVEYRKTPKAFEHVVHMISNRKVAEEFKTAYDATIEKLNGL